LAVHIAVIAMLYGVVGVSTDTLRAMAAWKEAVAVMLFLFVALRSPLGFGPRTPVTSTDTTLGALLGLATIFLVGSHTILDVRPSLTGQLYGFRDAVFFFALYYVGRATPELLDDPRTLRRLMWVGVFTSVVAVFEILYVTPEMLVAIGVSAYFNEFLDIGETTQGNRYGLPDNYWSYVGGEPVRRAGSTFLTSQGFAIPFLIILAVVTWRIFADDRRGKFGWIVAYVTLWGGLLLSITRMTTIACAIQILAALTLRKRAGLLMAVLMGGTVAVIVAGIAKPSFGTFVWQTLSGQTGSNASHAKDLANGIDALLTRPWGWGLGTADQTALRNGLEPLTFDNMYLKYADELGILGVGLLVATMGTIFASARSLALNGETPERRWAGGVVCLATIGMFVNGGTSNVFNSPWLAYVYCWLSGAVVTAAYRLKVRESAVTNSRGEEPAELPDGVARA
jgi:hypothetical protein